MLPASLKAETQALPERHGHHFGRNLSLCGAGQTVHPYAQESREINDNSSLCLKVELKIAKPLGLWQNATTKMLKYSKPVPWSLQSNISSSTIPFRNN